MKNFVLLPLLFFVVLSNACVLVNPKDVDTSLDRGFHPAVGESTGTIEISRPDKFNGMKAAFLVLENDAIVGTLANAGTLSWKSKEGKKKIRLEQVQPVSCKVFPGRDDKCFEDKDNQYVRTDQGRTSSINFDLRANQVCKVKFEPNMFGEDALSYSLEIKAL